MTESHFEKGESRKKVTPFASMSIKVVMPVGLYSLFPDFVSTIFQPPQSGDGMWLSNLI